MSGIAGILRRDGTPVRTGDIRRMLDAVPHRGGDRSGSRCLENAGLGICLRCTTPESLQEQTPAASHSGALVLAADARIDNRDDLIAGLRIAGAPGFITDSDLILAAYEKWGEDCPTHLIGDFSFAIWDQINQKFFCARDSAGIRCFYYYASPDLFVFASEIKSLTALPFVPRTLNEQRIGDYLVNLYEDRTITFYKDILRLPAASTLTATRERISVRTYWKLEPAREIRLRDDREYAEAFREQFVQAVKCRVRSAFGVGAAVSGGLDSSSIACTARDLLVQRDQNARLHTFSIVFPELPEQDLKAIDERRHIKKVLETGHFEPHYIRGDKLSPLHDSRRIHYHLDEANNAPNLYLHWGMYGAVRDSGVRVFLDGLDGDTTVSHGFEYLEDLLRAFRWKQLHKEAALLGKNLLGGSSAFKVLRRYCLQDMAPGWVVQLWRLMHGRIRELRSNGTMAHPDLTRRLALRQRVRQLTTASRPRNAREFHASVLSQALYAHALEMADKATAAFGIEARYPFFDRRLIEFCLALPATQKLAGGWNRVVFRRAMEGILPDDIRWRPGKGNLSPNFYHRLLDFDGSTMEAIASQEGGLLSRYVDTARMRRALQEYKAAPSAAGPLYSIRLFTAANLGLWLEQTQHSYAAGSAAARS